MNPDYTVDFARRFGWGSVTGYLNPVRCAHLEQHLIGPKVLEAGCGGGGYTDFLSKNGFDVVGLDVSAQLLGFAREQGFGGTYVEGSVTSLPFEDKSFDSSFAFDVLEHVDDVAALRELSRVTRKRVLIVVPKDDHQLQKFSLSLIHYTDPTHLRYYTPESLRELAETITPRRVEIIPELPIRFDLLFHEMARFDGASLPSGELRLLVGLRMARAAFQNPSRWFNKEERAALRAEAARNLATKVSAPAFKAVPTGLLAVIDL